MDASVKLALSLYLIKRSEHMPVHETHKKIQEGKPAQVQNWDKVKGIPGSDNNRDYTNRLIPSPFDQPIDLGYNNKQIVSGTGYGALILGKYRNE